MLDTPTDIRLAVLLDGAELDEELDEDVLLLLDVLVVDVLVVDVMVRRRLAPG